MNWHCTDGTDEELLVNYYRMIGNKVLDVESA